MNRLRISTPLVLALAAACGGTETPLPPNPSGSLEVAGAYGSAFGEENISATMWGATTIVEFDNDANFAITQSPADDMFNPSAFNRIVWTEPDAKGGFYYCFEVFGQATAEEAKAATDMADAADPATGGCGGFPWTQLYHAIEIEGRYHSNFGGVEIISHEQFSFMTVVEFDNDANFAITQSPADDMFNPNKFSKIVWTEPANGGFFYCQVTFGEDTAEAAKNTTEMADDSNPTVDGCSGFPWTELGPTLEIEGEYDSNFGGTETITSDLWTSYDASVVREYDNDANIAYLQLPEDAMFNPDTFAKVVWTEPDGGAFYYCWVDFGFATLDEAKTSTKTWDASDPDNTGCGGFSWTKLTAR
ncbi:MAG: hypothetical protein RIT81_28325 [Deltaproteobacteria bacterium]